MGRAASRSRSRQRCIATPARSPAAKLTARHDVQETRERYESTYHSNSRRARGPPPRPGCDRDERLQQLDDDPRYFDGAELGKAQRAAMGETGLNGRNTASFDPKSTLVRPAMRVLHARAGKTYGSKVNADDVIAVPAFMQFFGESNMYNTLAEEFHQLRSEKSQNPRSSASALRILKKVCKYFSIDVDGCSMSLTWTRPNKKPFTLEDDRTTMQDCPCNCIVNIAFGDRRELAFWKSSAEDSIYFPLLEDMLMLRSRDVGATWSHGVSAVDDRADDEGHIRLELKGASSLFTDETVLTERPPKATPGPCRDFRIGRCSYGEQCRFSHGEDGHSRSFDATKEVARPSMRVITVPTSKRYMEPVKHDDVIIVPNFFSEEEGWDIYYQLIKEMRRSQKNGDRKAEWISWHEGAHLLSQNPEGSATYHKVQERMAEYFSISPGNRGTRFNWYRDGSDWKPFHHDSAAFNAARAKNQNCTVGISFGCSRELAFRHATSEELVYFPQTNGMLFYFGRDTNIRWQHGINALPVDQQDGKGRISIILWGWCEKGLDELGSPPMLDDASRGKGKGKGKGDKAGFSMHSQRTTGSCRDFRNGKCSYGDRCRFSHD